MAALIPTSTKRTPRSVSSRRKRTSASLSGGRATDQAAREALLGRATQVDERVVHEAHVERGVTCDDRVRSTPEPLVRHDPGLLLLVEILEPHAGNTTREDATRRGEPTASGPRVAARRPDQPSASRRSEERELPLRLLGAAERRSAVGAGGVERATFIMARERFLLVHAEALHVETEELLHGLPALARADHP